jgi:isopentenyl-diphosphate delta-isomerase
MKYDHVYKATFNGEPSINKAEVEDWKFVDLAWLKNRCCPENPEAYTYWFKLILGHPAMRS